MALRLLGGGKLCHHFAGFRAKTANNNNTTKQHSKLAPLFAQTLTLNVELNCKLKSVLQSKRKPNTKKGIRIQISVLAPANKEANKRTQSLCCKQIQLSIANLDSCFGSIKGLSEVPSLLANESKLLTLYNSRELVFSVQKPFARRQAGKALICLLNKTQRSSPGWLRNQRPDVAS